MGSTRVEHARRELALLGAELDLAACLVAAVAAFESYGGHSGESHAYAVQLMSNLLDGRTLTALTCDPDEWEDRSEMSGSPVWQNVRDSRALSHDGGLTFTVVEDRPGQTTLGLVLRTLLPPAWMRALTERLGYTEEQAVTAIRAYLAAGPVNDIDRVELESEAGSQRSQFLLRRWGPTAGPLVALLYPPVAASTPVGVA